MTDCIVMVTTAGSREEAERLAEAVVVEQLAACVNILGPIHSIYRWVGKVQRDDEWLLLVKTVAANFAALAARIRSLHSYQTPEIVALPIAAGDDAYLAWLHEATLAEP